MHKNYAEILDSNGHYLESLPFSYRHTVVLYYRCPLGLFARNGVAAVCRVLEGSEYSVFNLVDSFNCALVCASLDALAAPFSPYSSASKGNI